MPAVAMCRGTHYARTYPAAPDQVGAVRRDFREFHRRVLDDETLDTAVLLVSELTANAVLHSGSERVTVHADLRQHYLVVEVLDEGGRPWCPAPADSDHPHGLEIVETLALEWGMEEISGAGADVVGGGASPGRMVWASLNVAA